MGACHSKRPQAARLRRYQREPVGQTAELENDRVSLRNDDLAVDRAAFFLRTRPPVDEQPGRFARAGSAGVVQRHRYNSSNSVIRNIS